MQKSELNREQLVLIKLFVEMLSDWNDVEDWNYTFERDFCSLTPEAFARYYGKESNIELGLYFHDHIIENLQSGKIVPASI